MDAVVKLQKLFSKCISRASSSCCWWWCSFSTMIYLESESRAKLLKREME
ncbi:hypothetical protein HanXRQr2_Chr07g0307611 [Helianthus annuus]|uniref:Uncharacterized protein n=1 Tax=Helianthus annuus TaxID=4232 RepID=A0A9K3NHI0_HELAN|nr:hypothetical protein HanXRQr2_Chr07g0307611 [Helianthus annuus]